MAYDAWAVDNKSATTNRVPTIDLFFFEDPKATIYQFPLQAVADWQHLKDELSQFVGGDGHLVLYAENGAVINERLWQQFLKDGAKFGFAFHREVRIHVEPLQSTHRGDFSVDFKFPETLSVFELRRHLHRTIQRIYHDEFPDAAKHLGLQQDNMAVLRDGHAISKYLVDADKAIQLKFYDLTVNEATDGYWDESSEDDLDGEEDQLTPDSSPQRMWGSQRPKGKDTNEGGEHHGVGEVEGKDYQESSGEDMIWDLKRNYPEVIVANSGPLRTDTPEAELWRPQQHHSPGVSYDWNTNSEGDFLPDANQEEELTLAANNANLRTWNESMSDTSDLQWPLTPTAEESHVDVSSHRYPTTMSDDQVSSPRDQLLPALQGLMALNQDECRDTVGHNTPYGANHTTATVIPNGVAWGSKQASSSPLPRPTQAPSTLQIGSEFPDPFTWEQSVGHQPMEVDTPTRASSHYGEGVPTPPFPTERRPLRNKLKQGGFFGTRGTSRVALMPGEKSRQGSAAKLDFSQRQLPHSQLTTVPYTAHPWSKESAEYSWDSPRNTPGTVTAAENATQVQHYGLLGGPSGNPPMSASPWTTSFQQRYATQASNAWSPRYYSHPDPLMPDTCASCPKATSQDALPRQPRNLPHSGIRGASSSAMRRPFIPTTKDNWHSRQIETLEKYRPDLPSSNNTYGVNGTPFGKESERAAGQAHQVSDRLGHETNHDHGTTSHKDCPK
ncbi:MAG: hypothetical protein Q9187_005245 [Circinaria calcarea]